MRSIRTLDSAFVARFRHRQWPERATRTQKSKINTQIRPPPPPPPSPHPPPPPPASQTFKDQILRLQVEALPVALSPQPGDGGVVLPTAVGLHGRGRRQEVPFSPQQHSAADAGAPTTFGAGILRQHPEREVVGGDVNVAGVVPPAGITLAALPVPPGVRLVPVVGADGYGDQPQSAKRQKEPRHG